MDSKTAGKFELHWYKPILISGLGFIAISLARLLLYSCRLIKVEGSDKEEEALARSGGKALYATWHQRIFYHIKLFANKHFFVMASQSRDAEYAIQAGKWIGLRFVRGSSSRGGLDARKELTRKVKRGAIGGMLADGPLGPPRVSKIGSVIIARDAGAPLIPITWGADRCWTLNSWDRTLIPKPFARVVFYYAEPIWIPPLVEGEELESYRCLFEKKLNEGTRWCDEYFGLERPWQKVKR